MHKYQLRKKALIAVALTISLAAASCGSDDDTDSTVDTEVPDQTDAATDSQPEVDPGPDTERSPGWALDPDAVRSSGVLELDDGPYQTYADDGQPPCSVRPGVVALYVKTDDEEGGVATPPNAIEESNGLLSADDLATAKELGVRFIPVEPGNEIEGSATLRSLGLLASPLYEMFPSPGRMYFPGTLPVPAVGDLVIEQERDDLQVMVIDTGGVETDVSNESFTITDAGQADEDRQTAIGSTDVGVNEWVIGHGEFVAGVVLSNSKNTYVRHVRVPYSEGSAVEEKPSAPGQRFDETDFMHAVLHFADRPIPPMPPSSPESPRVINLSAGFGACRSQAGVELVPVLSLALLVESIEFDDRILVAAAGNSGGDNRLTFPAAFAAPSALDSFAPVEDLDVELITGSCVDWFDETLCNDQDLLSRVENARQRLLGGDRIEFGSDHVIAVGASDTTPSGSVYSTTGDWVTTHVPGCHVSRYPAADGVRYELKDSDGNVTEATQVDFKPRDDGYSRAFWCGSSFATAVVSGMLADSYANDRNRTAQQLKRIACLADEGAAPSSSATTATTTSAPDVSRC